MISQLGRRVPSGRDQTESLADKLAAARAQEMGSSPREHQGNRKKINEPN